MCACIARSGNLEGWGKRELQRPSFLGVVRLPAAAHDGGTRPSRAHDAGWELTLNMGRQLLDRLEHFIQRKLRVDLSDALAPRLINDLGSLGLVVLDDALGGGLEVILRLGHVALREASGDSECG